MIRHFVYLPLVHIIVIFNQAAVSFVSLKPPPPGCSKKPYIASATLRQCQIHTNTLDSGNVNGKWGVKCV